MALPLDFKDKVLARLQERSVRAICEACGRTNWSVVDQAVSVLITDLGGPFTIPPPQIPSAGLVCNNCGYVRLFALGVLGLLPSEPAQATSFPPTPS